METATLSKNTHDVALSGRYNFSEKENKIYKLRQALEIGEQSQTANDFDSRDYLQKLHKKYL